MIAKWQHVSIDVRKRREKVAHGKVNVYQIIISYVYVP